MPTCTESGKQVGYECQLSVGGQIIAEARDIELPSSHDEIDASTRGSSGNKQWLMGMREWTVTIDQLWVFSDAGRQALETAYFARSLVEVSFLDKDGNGYEGCAFVREFTFGQPLNDAVTYNVTLRGHDALTAVVASS